MAYFKAFSRVDINKIDFSFVFENTVGKQFFDDVGRVLYGTRHNDLYSITGSATNRVETLYIAGPSFVVTAANDLQSGTLTYLELANGEGFTGFYATGVTVDVGRLLAVGATATTVDDAALVAAELGGNDSFDLSKFDDVFRGFGGNDVLFGDLGDDRLFGDAGNDILTGSMGKDRLDGGPGSDKFWYYQMHEGRDTIVDFRSNDYFAFTALSTIFSTKGPNSGQLPKGDLAPFRFHSGTKAVATTAEQRFLYRTTDDTLWWDVDGNGSSAPRLIADLTNDFRLSYQDILIV